MNQQINNYDLCDISDNRPTGNNQIDRDAALVSVAPITVMQIQTNWNPISRASLLLFMCGMTAASGLTVDAGAPKPEGGKKAALVVLPANVPVPQHNLLTPEKIALGKQLFFDPRLSGGNSMSCATCHLPSVDQGFADGEARSKGAGGKRLSRNTQGLLNVAFYKTLFWDGRADSLEEQALRPIENPNEMNQSLDELERDLNRIPGYVRQFRRVFNTRVSRGGIAKAIAAFQRTLISRNSPVDRFLAGDKQALGSSARNGMELFLGEAGCIRCHHGPLLSDGKYHRLGVSLKDRGREGVTGKKRDRYKFRTPTLRDVARTAPYMHDGSVATLEEVVIFYLRLSPASGPGGETIDIVTRNEVSLDEVDEIVAFLKALNGKPPKVMPPKLPE